MKASFTNKGLVLLSVYCFVLSGSSQASTFQVRSANDKPWIKILGSLGMSESSAGQPAVIVAGSGVPAGVLAAADKNILILQGFGKAAEQLGITSLPKKISVRQICDAHAPKMQIIWEQPGEISEVNLPPGFQVFATEKWQGTPVMAGKRTAHGAILWLATEPGETGIERFPYVLQALLDLGLTPPAESTSLWAFFDSSYRIRADPDYLAKRWRKAGIGALHVAAWHNVEPDPAADEYLRTLIEACHRHAISVYAWLELPHVSEKFWNDHPAWREKTAAGQDAQLDWRKLMNLQNTECRRQISQEISGLLDRFDWDGVNVAELYFESLEGASNPARFTPMNEDVRAEFSRTSGFDPKLLFDPASEHFAATHPQDLRKFLDYRANLTSQMQRQWLDVIDQSRARKPYLDVVLTHIDDRFDAGIRDELGADVARTLPLIEQRKTTLLVEDPATLWALGPDRYARLAAKYRDLKPDRERLAVDINVVERYQDVYPTKKQTGVELFELLHQAAVSFGQVALYFENSLERQDLALLPAAATSAEVDVKNVDELDVKAPETTRIAWQGPVEVDGHVWPLQSKVFVLSPGGAHRLTAGIAQPVITICDFNGQIRTAAASKKQVDVGYDSRTRAIALLTAPVSGIEVDGAPYSNASGSGNGAVMLPAGQHIVSFLQ